VSTKYLVPGLTHGPRSGGEIATGQPNGRTWYQHSVRSPAICCS